MKIDVLGLYDCHIGDEDEPLPDWREKLKDEPENDSDEDGPTPPEVIAMLGSDPDDWVFGED